MRSIISKLALAAAALAFTIGGVDAAPIKWDMPMEYGATTHHAKGDQFFAKLLSEKTGGQIQIVHHFGGALGYKSKDHFDAVGDGAVPIADTYVGPLQGIDPIFLLSSLPFLASTIEEAKILFEVAKPHYDAVFKKGGQKLLWSTPWPPSGIWGKKPIDSLEDLKNLKIRTYDANGTITLKEAGAAAIQLSWADVVPQLATGGIQSVLTSAEGGRGSNFWDHLNHFTEINYAAPLNMAHINLDVFNSLTPAQQKAVEEAGAATGEHNWKAVETLRQRNYKILGEHGVTVVKGVPAAYLHALSDAGQKALNQWLAKTGETGKKIIAEYKKRTGKM